MPGYGYGMMSGYGLGGLSIFSLIFYVLVIVLVTLGIIALWKYISGK